jgi:mannose-6-phosphate isomerase-like protein (cupin superfamily)
MISSTNLLQAATALTDLWSPKVIAQVNDQYVKVAKLQGEFVWHKHDHEDELFQVLRGSMRIQIENQPDVELHPGDICVIPRGTLHNPIAEQECCIALIETVTTQHTGDTQTPRTRSIAEQLKQP